MNDNRNIIPIGPNCGVAITLRNLGIRKKAYPWDWARDTDIQHILDVVKNKHAFNLLEWRNFYNLPHYLPHDIPGDSHGILENKFENTTLLEKYVRRFDRFFHDIYQPNTYLVRFGTKEDLPYLQELSNLLPNVNIIYIENGSDNDPETYEKLKKIFSDEKDPTYVFLEAVVYSDDRYTLPYPCNIDTVFEKILEYDSTVKPLYLEYLKEFDKTHTLIHDKFELVRFVYDALKEKGIEYCIL